MTYVLCETPMDVYELINIGRKSLVLAETKMTRLSCRAHAVCQLSIERRKKSPRTKKRSMQETYSIPDILIDKPDEKNNTQIDFATVPFNKADLRKRHSIAVTKVNENKRSPRCYRSPPPSTSKLPSTSSGHQRARANSVKLSDRRKNTLNDSPTSDLKNTPEYRSSLSLPSSNRRTNNKSTNNISDSKSSEKKVTMTDSIGIVNVKRLQDLYHSNIDNSEPEAERIEFDPENSFTFSEDSNDSFIDYGTSEYLGVENGHEGGNSVFVDVTECNGFDAEKMVLKSKISIIDLSGSERLSKSNADGERLKEAQNINLSLLELGNVISALASGKKKHIPYRNSVLTRLLQDSLGGNCKTKFLLCVSTKMNDINETKCTLEFGQKLTKVFTNPILNLDIDYKRKYDELMVQLKDNKKDHELAKKECTTQLTALEKEKQEKKESICDQQLLMNSMQIKLDNADREHKESNRKIGTLQQTLVDKERMLEMKDEKLINLKMEFDTLLEKLEEINLSTDISKFETVTCDAATNTSLIDLSATDTIDGSIDFTFDVNDIVTAVSDTTDDTHDFPGDAVSNTSNNTSKTVEDLQRNLIDATIDYDHALQTFPANDNSTIKDINNDIDLTNTSYSQNSNALINGFESNVQSCTLADVLDVQILVETMDATTNTIEDDYLRASYSTKIVETCDVATNTSGNDQFSGNSVRGTSNATTNTADISFSNPIVVTFIQSPKIESNKTNVSLATTSTASIAVETFDATTNTPTTSNDNIASNGNSFELSSNENAKALTNVSLNCTVIEDDYSNDPTTQSHARLFMQYGNIDIIRSAILVELLTLQHLCDRSKITCNESFVQTGMLGNQQESITTLNEDMEPIVDGVSAIISEIFSILPFNENQPSMNSSKLSSEQLREQVYDDTDNKTAMSKTTLKTAPIALKYAPVKDQLVFLVDYLRNRKQSTEKELLNITYEITNDNDLHLDVDSISEQKIIEILIQKLSDGNSLPSNNLEKFHKLLNIVLCDHVITACLLALTQKRHHDIDIERMSNSTAESEHYKNCAKVNGPNLSYELAVLPNPKHQTNANTFLESNIDDNIKNRNDNDGKKRKTLLSRFLCMSSKSAKEKKTSKNTKKDMYSNI